MGCVFLPPLRHLQAHLQQNAMSRFGYGSGKGREVSWVNGRQAACCPLLNPVRCLFWQRGWGCVCVVSARGYLDCMLAAVAVLAFGLCI